MSIKKQYIPAPLKSAVKNGYVTDTSEILDENKGKKQDVINQETDSQISGIKGGSTKSIAQLDSQINGNGGIDDRLGTVEQLAEISIGGGDAQIATGEDFTNPDATKRAKVPTVGAVLDGMNDGVYDVSKRNPTGGENSDGKFTLAYILANADTLIPTSWRHGGMSISFVSSVDNKYVQFRLMSDSFNTTVANWQGVDDEPTAGSDNLVKSGGVADKNLELFAAIGFNIWDEIWEVGSFNYETGAEKATLVAIRSKNFVPILPNKDYYKFCGANKEIVPLIYDKDYNFIEIGQWGYNRVFTTPANAAYMRIGFNSGYGTTYNNDVCINLSQPDKNVDPHNGQYLPYGYREIFNDVISLKNSLMQAGSFSTVGDANQIKVNRSYIGSASDVTDNSNLPAELASIGSSNVFYVSSVSASENRAYQIIVSNLNIFTRTVIYTNGAVSSSTAWKKYYNSDEVENLYEVIKSYIENITGYAFYKHMEAPSGAWTALTMTNTLKSGISYLFTLDSEKNIASGTLELKDSSNNTLFTQSLSNVKGVSKTFIPEADVKNAKIRFSLNYSDGEGSVIDIISSINNNGILEEVQNNTNSISNILISNKVKGGTEMIISDNGWYRSSSFQLKKDTKYQFRIDFDTLIEQSSYFNLFSGGSNIKVNNVRNTKILIFDYTPSDNLDNVVFSTSINAKYYPIVAHCVWGLDGIANDVRVFKNSDAVDKLEQESPLYTDFENVENAVNGAFLTKSVTEGLDCTPTNIYGTHNASIYIYNDKIYLGFAANKTDTTEDQTKYNFELVRTTLNGVIESSTPIVSVGDTIGGQTIQRCQAISFLPVDDTIHIYLNLYVTGGYKLYHTTYDITNDSFGAFDEVSYIDESGSSVEAEKNGEQYIAQSWFSYDNHDYCTAVYFDNKNTGIAYTDDFVTFTFIAKLDDIGLFGAGGEMSAEYIQEFNKFVLVYRTPSNDSYLVFLQYDISNGKWENWNKLPDATARPMFFKYNGNVYLMNNTPYSRKNLTIWKYLTADTWSRIGVMVPLSVAKLGFACTYFAFFEYENEIYMAGICYNLTKIQVCKVPIETVSNQDIFDKFLEIFS